MRTSFAPDSHVSTKHSGRREVLAKLLAPADIQLDGSRPWDITIHDERSIDRILAEGGLGAGESYMDGWWDCRSIDQMLARVLRAGLDNQLPSAGLLWAQIQAHVRNMQSRHRAWIVGRKHYDIGDDLYRHMLDPRMIYSCGYWAAADNLAAAQEAKLDLVCRKLGIREGMRVLDVGCGWGGAAEYIAQRYGAQVVGCTISVNQAQAATERCAALPVDILLQDYRDLAGRFDRIYSIGMFEHVGPRNYVTFLDKMRELLEPDGLMLLHTIGSLHSGSVGDPWLTRYIFPNGVPPSMAQISDAAEGRFVVEDWHNFGSDYDRTLMAWSANFTQSWPELKRHYDERFRRMWRYYLHSCAGAFRARHNQLWQLVLSPTGVAGGYRSVR
ncbi:MAG: cyclopropane fatty acyl phospholipid synthase [Gammaproteobacteria bacterium PRO9]|nr:cyclopropane fatty acyl phospholipid synthase [Gammaproteobacteria bacterium PRO9]